MNHKNKKELTKDDVEKIFEATWNNWSSRRRCESTHTPEYIKKMNKIKKD